MFDYHNAFSRNIGWLTSTEQTFLASKKVAIAGMGGVGGEYLVTLSRLGLRRFSIADFDTFEVHNFNRQAGAFMSTLDQPKADVMHKVALDINPDAEITCFNEAINEDNIDAFLDDVDVYVDSLDFFVPYARKLVYEHCEKRHIPILTAAPFGIGTAYLAFLPGKMSANRYFDFQDTDSEHDLLLKFLVGLAPAMLQRSYLVDPTRANFKQQKGPSTVMAVKLCAGVAGSMVLKLLLNRGELPAAPVGLHFDAYRNQFKKTWRPGGNRHPLQKLAISIAKRIVLSQPETKTPPSPPDKLTTPMLKVLDIARWAPSGDNSQIWRFEITSDTSCIVHAKDTRDWVVYDLEGNASKMALGALIENIDLAARHMGFGLDWQFERDERLPYHAFGAYKIAITLTDEGTPLTPAETKLFYSIPLRTTQRKRMGTRALTSDELAAFHKVLPKGYGLVWKSNKKERLAIAKLLFGNGYTRLSMPEGFRVHSQIIEFTPRKHDRSTEQNQNNEFSKDRLPAKSLGVGPVTLALTKWSLKSWPRLSFLSKYLGGTLLPRFLMDFLPAYHSSAIFALTAPQQATTDMDYINAGRALQRLWLQASVMQLGFQPCHTPVIFSEYQRRGVKFTDTRETITNAEKMEALYQEIFGAAVCERIVYMARVGRSEVPQSRSVRLGLNELEKIGE